MLEAWLKAIVARALPQPVVEGNDKVVRAGRYGEVVVLPAGSARYGVADEGQYFVASNPTVATGLSIGAAAQTGFGDLAAGIAIVNSDTNPSATTGKRIYLDYVKLVVGTAIAGVIATPFYNLAVRLDTIVSRYASGGTPALVAANTNADSGNKSIASVFVGTIVLAAISANGRQIGRAALRGAAAMPGVNDEFLLTFGADVKDGMGNENIAQAVPAVIQVAFPPVILGPGNVLSFHFWAPGQTAAPVAEVEIGYWER